ncbi:MAG: aldehyde ferredoxin oxidoreductase N-terminal domain-containing protein [Candidatus Hodarchaeota archaeon]
MANDFGYAGNILNIDLSSGKVTETPTKVYADRFIGGRGLAAKLYWDQVAPETGALDPDNLLIFVTGPLAGIPGLAGSRWQICGKSPITTPEHFCYSNLGGSWGAYLKFAGFDGIVIKGKADKPAFLFIHDGTTELRDASSIWGKQSIEVQRLLKNKLGNATRVLATGPAGDNRVVFATILADGDSCGTGGFGAVMGSKNLKAIAVAGSRKVMVAEPERLQEIVRYLHELKKDMPAGQERPDPKRTRELCYGCINGCGRSTYQADDGSKGKLICQAGSFYAPWARQYYKTNNDVQFHATKRCDYYGLDTKAIAPLITWLSRCRDAEILTDENTCIPLSTIGSLEFIDTLIKKIAFREGFGDILAHGISKAANSVASGAQQIADFSIKAEQSMTYGPRMYITTGLLYMVEPRQPIQELHEVVSLIWKWLEWVEKRDGAYMSSDVLRSTARRFWGSQLAADFSVYDGKALAAARIQDRQYAKESLILCDASWPITHVRNSTDHIGDPTIESKTFSAVTGHETDEEGLYRFGERVFNLQRAILIREGHNGRVADTLPDSCYTTSSEDDWRNPDNLIPGKDGQVTSKNGVMLDRGQFEKVKDEYYTLRGWDVSSGLQTQAKLEEIGLADIAHYLKQRGLIR